MLLFIILFLLTDNILITLIIIKFMKYIIKYKLKTNNKKLMF